jgi:hypothetical protein
LNFAFNTVLLFLIIFSGLAARRAYFSQEFSKNYIKKNTFDELLGGIFLGIALQIIGITLLQLCGVAIDFKTLGFLLLGAKDDATIAGSFSVLQTSLQNIAYYNGGLILLGVLLGHSARFVVRKTKRDRKSRFFRFDNEWHYILSGEIQEFPNNSGRDKIDARKFGNKYLNVLVKVDDHFIIYSGILIEYFLSNDGGLDLLCLKGVKRKTMKKGEEAVITIEDKMNVDILILPYSQILNLTITYYILESTEPKVSTLRRLWQQAKRSTKK